HQAWICSCFNQLPQSERKENTKFFAWRFNSHVFGKGTSCCKLFIKSANEPPAIQRLEFNCWDCGRSVLLQSTNESARAYTGRNTFVKQRVFKHPVAKSNQSTTAIRRIRSPHQVYK